MTDLPKYLLDADTFIRAFRQHYRFSICPAYWEALARFHEEGRLASIAQVKSELLRGKDSLANWVKKHLPDSFFKKTEDVAVIKQYSAISNWIANSATLSVEAKAKFASAADGWLVAYAGPNNYSVCTYEASAPLSKSNIKLPDIATTFGVSCVPPYDMLEELKVRMVLSKRV